MNAAWMMYVLAVSVLVGVAAFACDRALRLLRLPSRFVWLLGLAGVGGTAVWTALAPRPQAVAPLSGVQIGALVSMIGANAPNPSLLDLAQAWLLGAAATVDEAMRTLVARVTPAGDRVILIGCLTSAAIAIVVLAALYLRFAVVRRRWTVRELCGARVRVAPSTGPAVIGVVRPEIVVPSWLLERSADELAMVVQHEREHVRGLDAPILALGWFGLAVMPWNPVAWWMLRQLRASVEVDCDARVLRRGVAAREYGTLLVDLAERNAGITAGAVALGVSPSHLERRLMAMRPMVQRFARVRAVVFGVVAVAGLFAITLVEAPVASAQGTPADTSAAARARQAKVNEMKVVIRNAMTAEEAYYADNGGYTSVVGGGGLRANVPEPIAVAITLKDKNGYTMTTTRPDDDGWSCTVRVATAAPSDQMDGMIVCEPPGNAVSGPHGTTTTFHMQDLPDGRPQFVAVADTIDGNPGPFKGILFVDGIQKDLSVMRTLDSKQIESINVLKAEAAVKAYGDKGRNGVIVIKMKH